MENNKSLLVKEFQSLIAIKILHSMALGVTFAYGPLSFAIWLLLFSKWDAPNSTLNIISLVAFFPLAFVKKYLDRKLEKIKSALIR